MTTGHLGRRSIGLLAALAVSAPVVLAAEPADGSGTGSERATGTESSIESVVVTARRREERLLDVPVAVSALSGAELEARGALDVQGLTFNVPSLQVAASVFGPSVPGYTIRGQRLIEQLISQDPSVGVYFADVVQQRPHGTNQVLYDISSVQVLKGPQGTLFGRNTTGGAVLIEPNKPVLGRTEGFVELNVGNYDRRGGSFALNLPAGETFALRLAGKMQERDGFGTNLLTGRDIFDQDIDSVRLSALWEPSSSLSSYTVASYFRAKDHGAPFYIVEVNPTSTGAAFFPLQDALTRQQGRSPFDVEADAELYNRTKTRSISNTTTYEFSSALSLKNIIGYRKVDNEISTEFDGTPSPAFNSANSLEAKQFTEELQLLGNALNGSLEYIVGAYYFRESGTDKQISQVFTTLPSSREGYAVNKSQSLFVQADYKVTDRVTLTGGFRHTWDDRRLDLFPHVTVNPAEPLGVCRLAVSDTDPTPLDPCLRRLDADFDSSTYLVTASYRPSDEVMVYATHNTGYRSGGLNMRAAKPSEGVPYDPEKAKNYELGIKAELFDRRLRVNAAGYHTDYRDIQRAISLLCPGSATLCTSIINAARARIRGFELEASAQPVTWLRLGGFYGYTRARYREFDVMPQALDYRFAFVPAKSYGLNGEVSVPLPNSSELTFALNYYYQSHMQGADLNDTGPIPSYDLMNGSIGWTKVLGSPIDARFFVNNLTDKRYASASSDLYQSIGTNAYLPGDPRTYGLSLTYRFD
jgi:iron complex outermembrane receptor protein